MPPEQEFGSDGQLRDVAQGDPLAAGTAAAPARDAPDDIFAASEPASAAQRLRAFEDEHLGPDAVRIGGHVEKGHGSRFAGLSQPHRRHYTALERLVDAETNLRGATAAQAKAQADFDAAQAHADNSAPAEPEPSTERSESEQGG